MMDPTTISAVGTSREVSYDLTSHHFLTALAIAAG